MFKWSEGRRAVLWSVWLNEGKDGRIVDIDANFGWTGYWTAWNDGTKEAMKDEETKNRRWRKDMTRPKETRHRSPARSLEPTPELELTSQYHPGYFGKVGMRHYHLLKNHYFRPTINIDKVRCFTIRSWSRRTRS